MYGVVAKPITSIASPLPTPTAKNTRPIARSSASIETASVPAIAPAPMPTMTPL